jgi:hypothetical protein
VQVKFLIDLSHASDVHQSKAGCDHLVEAIKAKEEKIHILVNNSGMSWGAPFDKYADVPPTRA